MVSRFGLAVRPWTYHNVSLTPQSMGKAFIGSKQRDLGSDSAPALALLSLKSCGFAGTWSLGLCPPQMTKLIMMAFTDHCPSQTHSDGESGAVLVSLVYQ